MSTGISGLSGRLRRSTFGGALAAVAMVVVPVTVEGGAERTVVQWWSWSPAPAEAEDLTSAFEEEHPNIDVQYKHIQFTDYVNSLRLGVSSDSGPDIYALQAGEITLKFGQFAQDLTPLAVETYGDAWADNLVAGALEDFQLDDQQLAMPQHVIAVGQLWYNKTQLDEWGLEPPATWEEWLSLCDQIEQHDVSCFVQGAKDAWVNYDTYIALAGDLAPGKFYDAVAGELAWTDPDLVSAFQYWSDMFTEGIMQEGALGINVSPDAIERWARGEANMIMQGTWNSRFMASDTLAISQGQEGGEPDPAYVMLPIPFPDIDGDGEPAGPFGGAGNGLAISQRSDVQEAAWTFIRWLTMEQAGQEEVAAAHFIPVLQGVPLNTEELIDPAVQAPALEEFTELVNDLVGYREIPYPELKTALGDALAAVAAGEQSPEEAAQAVEDVSQQIER